jgi:hypothetical protein
VAWVSASWATCGARGWKIGSARLVLLGGWCPHRLEAGTTGAGATFRSVVAALRLVSGLSAGWIWVMRWRAWMAAGVDWVFWRAALAVAMRSRWSIIRWVRGWSCQAMSWGRERLSLDARSRRGSPSKRKLVRRSVRVSWSRDSMDLVSSGVMRGVGGFGGSWGSWGALMSARTPPSVARAEDWNCAFGVVGRLVPAPVGNRCHLGWNAGATVVDVLFPEDIPLSIPRRRWDANGIWRSDP